MAKSKFAEREVEYLGYTINKDGIHPTADRVKAIIEFEKPKNISELRRYLGIINFYHRFIKDAAAILAPLNKYLIGAKKHDKRPVEWTQEAEEAFQASKNRLSENTLLVHPKENAKLILKTDASNVNVGAVLEQEQNGEHKPLGFFSKKLSETQQRYSTYDRELLAIYLTLKFFRHFAEGQDVTVLTDHRPLQYAFSQASDKASERQRRQLDFVSQITTNIIYIAGDKNQVADALSRINEINMPVIVSTEELYEEQQKDEELKTLLRTETSLSLKQFRLDGGEKTIYCDVNKEIRIYVPKTLRKRIFDNTHNLAHPSGRTTKKMIAQRFVWPRMQKDIAYWAKTCLPCQKSKIHRHNHRRPEQIPIPEDRFQHVHMDIVGPLPNSKGYKYCLTIIDRTTRWLEATPIANTTADTITDAFFRTWIARFGAPSVITTDRGSQFESLIFESMTKLIGSRRIRTTAYHPQANDMIERWHRSLKAAIKCQGTKEWVDALPMVLLGLRNSWKEDIKASAAEMVFGTTLRLPGEYFINDEPRGHPEMFTQKLRERIRQIRPMPAAHHIKQRTFTHRELEDCSHVFVRIDRPKGPLEQPYEGPFEVTERLIDFLYRVNYKGQPAVINTDRLKPAFIERADVTQTPIRDAPIQGPSRIPKVNQKQPGHRVSFVTPDMEPLRGD